MVPFAYLTVDDAAAAQRAAQDGGARLVAGGTTLLDLMKLQVEHPSMLVDINQVPLAQVEEQPDGGVRVGALVRNSDMAQHELIRRGYPLVSEAILAGASAQLRNMATTGGNLLQRTRCSYFRDTASACNKREPGSGCSAYDGYNRSHAVLGGSPHCVATHPSDLCVALSAVDATILIVGRAGQRRIPFDAFHLTPSDRPDRETVLVPGDFITAVDLPALPFAKRSVYVKVRDRASYAFALASAAVALDIEDDVIREARIALGGVATKPWRAREAERLLVGQAPTRASYQAAAELALAGAEPRAFNRFKVELAKRVIVRALTKAGALA